MIGLCSGQRILMLNLLLLVTAGLSCGKRPSAQAPAPETNATTLGPSDAARPVPRRANPIIVTNSLVLNILPPSTPTKTNNPPTITCGPSQSFPCSSADGLEVTLTVHVEDPDGDQMAVVWSADGKERYTQQVPSGSPPTSADLTYSYTFTPGDHGVKVTVSDGKLSASCETSVTVQKDSQPPQVACPRDIVTTTDPGHCTAVVNFQSEATDNCPNVTVVCDPPTGTAFPIGVTPVTCTATDTAGNVSTCTFNVVVQVTNRCPQNDNFWRQNPSAWPVNSLTLGGKAYTKSQLLSLLYATAPNDASIALARPLIAASLNTAAGADPRPICGELAQANDLFSQFTGKLPFRVFLAMPSARAMFALGARLNSYNNGMFTPNCVP
jgi:hypothetical protein